jgi:hypothetical protein
MYWLWPVRVTDRLPVWHYNRKLAAKTAGKLDILCTRVVIVVIENVKMLLAGQIADK